MIKSRPIAQLLTTYAATQGGVFSSEELRAIINTPHPTSVRRMIQQLLHEGILTRFCRGFYVTADFSLEMMSQRLAPQSYISCGTILAQHLAIGSIPRKTVYGIKRGRSRTYRSAVGSVVHLGLGHTTQQLLFGYTAQPTGIAYADLEKAFLDTLYFYQSGYPFSFNIYSDINTVLLNHERLNRYLRAYKNPKFVQFVRGVIDDSTH